MPEKENRQIERIEITVRHHGEKTVHDLHFDFEGEELFEEEMREVGFCGDIILEDDEGHETTLRLDADNARWCNGQTEIDGLTFTLYEINDNGRPAGRCGYAEVTDFKAFYAEEEQTPAGAEG